MKIVTIVGARPQFIKAAPVSRALREAGHIEFLVHTGQHYNGNMSAVFFEELEIPEPDVNLGVGSGSHGQQTGQMLTRIEEVLIAQTPAWVLVYGDTNSTLAGALAAVKIHSEGKSKISYRAGIPVAHVEAGLRSFNRQMPEEHNRVLTDHVSDLLFCPTQTAVKNLEREGITRGVHLVGDVMYDSVLYNIKLAEERSQILEKLKLTPETYALATVHRPENTDDQKRLTAIFHALEHISQDGLTVIVPLHPRTRQRIAEFGLANPQSMTRAVRSVLHRVANPLCLQPQTSNLKLIAPVSYLDMLLLEKQAKVILTDSGGVQKEAYWFKVPCVTLRDETEWVETVESGWNVLVGCEPARIVKAVEEADHELRLQDAYGNGRAAERIVQLLSPV